MRAGHRARYFASQWAICASPSVDLIVTQRPCFAFTHQPGIAQHRRVATSPTG